VDQLGGGWRRRREEEEGGGGVYSVFREYCA